MTKCKKDTKTQNFIPKKYISIPQYIKITYTDKKIDGMLMKKILVVDDEPDVRETVKIILEQKGYKVYTAADGDECIKKLNKETPDLILLDIMMPGMPIAEVVKKIEKAKIAFMSVVRISEARKKGLCKQDNVVDFIQKPFDVLDLIQRVNLILNEKTR